MVALVAALLITLLELELELEKELFVAASTAWYALTSPAPQVLPVQLHSASLIAMGLLLVGTVQLLAAVLGKGVAVLRKILVM